MADGPRRRVNVTNGARGYTYTPGSFCGRWRLKARRERRGHQRCRHPDRVTNPGNGYTSAPMVIIEATVGGTGKITFTDNAQGSSSRASCGGSRRHELRCSGADDAAIDLLARGGVRACSLRAVRPRSSALRPRVAATRLRGWVGHAGRRAAVRAWAMARAKFTRPRPALGHRLEGETPGRRAASRRAAAGRGQEGARGSAR